MDLKARTAEQLSVNTIRGLAMDAVQKANSGHPGTPMALAPVAYTIFTKFLRHNPANPEWPDRDRFVLSVGHASMLLYSALHLTGYDLSLQDLKDFRQWGSKTAGHPEYGHTPGAEATTGPLGQGFANGVGMAMAERFLAERYNRPGHEIVDHHVYALCSDGDLMEGVSQEAASIAGQLGLGKLIYVYDDNHITIDGTTEMSFDREDKAMRFEAYGWHVQRVENAEDLEAIEAALRTAKEETERPSLIVLRSRIAYPAPNAVDTSKAHGAPLGEDEIRATKEVMGFDPDEQFAVSEEVYEHMSMAEKGRELETEWREHFEAWRGEDPLLAEEWDRAWSGQLEPGYEEALPTWDPSDTEKLATRKAGAAAMDAIKDYAPTMVGGAADLVESTGSELKGGGLFSASGAGRNVAWGIREHAMGSAVNGMALHGGIVKPFGSTFLIFSDYMRPAIR
ncbi:MAG: transketolase, partial [Rubrobacteraceae bacterium]